jgi:antitoxin VapB
MRTTSVFQSGHSQAVRVPKEFRFAARRVTIRRDGDAVVLEPVREHSWPKRFFAKVRIDDSAFSRPAQGDLPAARSLDADR